MVGYTDQEIAAKVELQALIHILEPKLIETNILKI